ncbi:hypothetical protein BBJ28_00006248 [Nothophytophthora sp. Chile5]|nr:hypothetical protein BBJ28_00006248 [Nothophytophthora sp. Chile5]
MASSAADPRTPVPRLAAVVRGVSPRKSVIQRLTPFQSSKPVSVVPYAPERLSITQTALTPAMIQALAEKRAVKSPVGRKEDSVTTIFAALRMRRVLHRVQAGHDQTEARVAVDETKANLERHLKVLSRYKIRQVDTDGDEAQQLRNLPRFMSTLVIIIYQSLMLPYALAFGSNDTTELDLFMNSIFALDIVVGFSTPILADADETVYITDRWQIASNYSRGWCVLPPSISIARPRASLPLPPCFGLRLFFDLLACFPFDYVLLWVNNTNYKSNLNVLGLLKGLRIPRLLRLVRLLRVVRIVKIRPELRRWLQYSRHANLLRLVRLVASFLVINHYVACIWSGLVMSDETRALDPNSDVRHMYIVAYYQSLLVVMGQNIEVFEDTEYIFCVLVMVMGAVLMALVFGNVAILIANYYESQSSHQKKMEWLFASMNRMKLPHDLQNRINGYYQAMWERHGTLDGAVTAFIPELSRNLAYEVELFLRMDMINRAPIFQNCSAKVVQELVMELELQVFMPGDYVVVRGEVGNDMYFVQNGLCEVTKEIEAAPAPPVPTAAGSSPSAPLAQAAQPPTSHSPGSDAVPVAPPKPKEIVLKVLGQGDYFGEIALLMNCKRTANVRSQVFSELCTLTREVFENISMRYLEDRSIIEKFIMDKYDPGMLQAAMKQSHEISMRNNGTAAAAAAAAAEVAAAKASTISPLQRQQPNPGQPGGHHTLSLGEATSRGELATAKLAGMLTKVLDRLTHLEAQLGKEAQERRESESRMRMSITAASLHLAPSGSPVDGHPRHPAALGHLRVKTVADEPERVSQRELRVVSMSSDVVTAIEGSNAGIEDAAATVDATAAEEGEEEEKPTKRPPPHVRMSSWRNSRRESLSSLRLRLTGKLYAGQSSSSSSIRAGVGVGVSGAGGRSTGRSTGNSRHSSRSQLDRSQRLSSASELVFLDSSDLKPEPELRSAKESWRDDDEQTDQFPSGLLDDLASSLDLRQRNSSFQAEGADAERAAGL